jgi:SAM-dependent methyltransferase
MNSSVPHFDTTAFLDEFRAAQLSHLLVAAVTEFDVGSALHAGPLSFADLCERLELADRPAIVLLTALRSMELIDVDGDGRLVLTGYGREKLSPESPFHLRGYIGLGVFSGDVQHTIECLRRDQPPGAVSFVYHEDGHASALDDPMTADVLTRAMADRARSVAPFFAQQVDLSGARLLVDVGGGHGLYSYALLKKHPDLQTVIIDRAPALRVAREYAAETGLEARVQFVPGDVHTIELEQMPNVVLIANLLHDYNAEDAEGLVQHFASCLAPGGRLLVVDAFLNSVPPGAPPVSDGPRAVAAYSGLLFSLCEGRCYRFDEVQTWLQNAGLTVDENMPELPAHGSVVTGWKRGVR